MEIKNTPVSAAGNERKKPFLSALRKKRGKIALSITTAITMWMMWMMTAVSAFADTSGGGDDGEQMFNEIIGWFAKWIGRIGLVVGFIGAVMFGLAIKNEDSDAKTRGLMTMASGFVVYAITKALHLFGIT